MVSEDQITKITATEQKIIEHFTVEGGGGRGNCLGSYKIIDFRDEVRYDYCKHFPW